MNKAILVGRLTADPELKATNNGTSVCSFTVAVNRRFARAGEERQADFINCVAWRQTAEFISKYFAKGRMIGVVGSIQTRSWDDQNGNKRYATEVIVDEAYFTESKGSGNGSTAYDNNRPQSQAQPHADVASSFSQLPDGGDFMPNVADDDLPF